MRKLFLKSLLNVKTQNFFSVQVRAKTEEKKRKIFLLWKNFCLQGEKTQVALTFFVKGK